MFSRIGDHPALRDRTAAGDAFAVALLLADDVPNPRRTGNEIDLLAFLDDRGCAFPVWARPAVLGARLLRGRRRSLAAADRS